MYSTILIRFSSIALMASILSGCALNSHQSCCESSAKVACDEKAQELSNEKMLAKYELPLNGPVQWERPIYRFLPPSHFKNAPAILLLHEFPYLTPNTFSLAEKLAKEGFTVYLPTLYGKALESNFLPNFLYLATSPDWNVVLSENETSPIVKKLRVLVKQISKQHGNGNIGVIGQCLTGSLPLALLSDPCVQAAVCAQPAVPFASWTLAAKQSLGLSRSDICGAKKSGVPILALRFERDTLSPVQRLDHLKKSFDSGQVRVHTVPSPANKNDVLYKKYGILPHAHPTLTYAIPCDEINDGKNPVNIAFKEVVRYLHRQL